MIKVTKARGLNHQTFCSFVASFDRWRTERPCRHAVLGITKRYHDKVATTPIEMPHTPFINHMKTTAMGINPIAKLQMLAQVN